MVKKLLEKIATVTDKYAVIECEFTINSRKYEDREAKLKEAQVNWKLYIAETVTHHEFPTFAALESFVGLLCLELERVDTKAVEKVVEIAEELCLQKEEKNNG